MAKTLVVRALREFIDTWTEGTEWSQLEVRVLQGALALMDLKLKARPLEQRLGRPIEVESSRIGRIQATWSWSGLLSTPVQLDAKDIDIHIRIQPGSVPCSQVEDRQQHQEESERQPSDNKCADPSKPSLLGQLLLRVCDRLQLQASSVRLHIELANRVALQMCMDGCSLRSVAAPQDDGSSLQQELRLDGFGLWITPAQHIAGAGQQADLCGEDEAPGWASPHGAVVEPCSLRASAKRISGRRFQDIYGLQIGLDLEALPISWSHEQYVAVVQGLEALDLRDMLGKPGTALSSWFEDKAPEAAQSDDEDDWEVVDLEELSPSDRESLQEKETPPPEGAVLDVRLQWHGASLRWRRNCVDKETMLLEAEGAGVFRGRLSNTSRSMQLDLHRLSIIDGRCPLQALPLLRVPRAAEVAESADGNPFVQLKLSQEMHGPYVMDVRVVGLRVSVLPRWAECAALLTTSVYNTMQLLPSRVFARAAAAQVPMRWSASFQDSRLALPANPRKANAPALFCCVDTVKANGQGPALSSITINGMGAALAQGSHEQEISRNIDVRVQQPPGGRPLKAIIETVEVSLSLTQLLVLLDVVHSLKDLNPNVTLAKCVKRVPIEVCFEVNQYQISVMDKVGVACHLGLEVRGFAKGHVTPADGCGLQLGGLAHLLGAPQGSRELLPEFVVNVALNSKGWELHCPALNAICTYQSMHSLWYMAQAVMASPLFTKRARPHHGSLNDDDNQLRVKLDHMLVRIDDPQGLCGHAMVVLTVSSLDLRCAPLAFELSSIKLEVQQGMPPPSESSSSDGQVASKAAPKPILAMMILELRCETVVDVAGRFISMGACIEVQDRKTQTTALTTMGEPIVFEGFVGSINGTPGVSKAQAEAEVVRIDTSEEFIRASAEVCGRLRVGLSTLLRTRSLKLEERPDIELEGGVVTKVSPHLERAGLAPGSILLKLGQNDLVSDSAWQMLLDSTEWPAPIFFMVAQKADEEIYLDLVMHPFTLGVAGFRTSYLDLQVQRASVKMPEVTFHGWRGTWGDLRGTVGRKYAEALGRDMPWLVSAARTAGKVLAHTMASNMRSSVERLSSSSPAGLVHTIIERGKQTRGRTVSDSYQFGDVTRGILATGGILSTSPPSSPSEHGLSGSFAARPPERSPSEQGSFAARTPQGFGRVLSEGKASRGAASSDSYKFGDVTRGLISMLKR